MISPKISVIMPLYNSEGQLGASLDSFFGQTIADDCEIICVNDGSTDETLALLNEIQLKHPSNMVVLSQDNQGSGPARNFGMEKARGEFIAFLDADDKYPEPDVLEVLYKAAKDYDVSIAGGSMIAYNGSEYIEMDQNNPEVAQQVFFEDGVMDYRDYQFDFGYQRFIYGRNLLIENNICFPDLMRYQDPVFFVRAMVAAGKFYATKKPTYWYLSVPSHVKWTTEKTLDLLKGIQTVGEIAATHNLADLFKLNLCRLNVTFWEKLRVKIVDELDIKVLDAYIDGMAAMLTCPSELERYALYRQSLSLILVNDFAPALWALAEDRDTIKRQEAAIKNQQEIINSLASRLEEVTTSTTWKVGKAATVVPRKIKASLDKK